MKTKEEEEEEKEEEKEEEEGVTELDNTTISKIMPMEGFFSC